MEQRSENAHIYRQRQKLVKRRKATPIRADIAGGEMSQRTEQQTGRGRPVPLSPYQAAAEPAASTEAPTPSKVLTE